MTNYYTKLVANIIFPIHEKLKEHTSVSVKESLEKSQWFDKDKLLELQFNRLKELLLFAGESSPYYQNIFSKIGFDPESIRSISDLAKLPVLTKQIIKDNSEEIKPINGNRLVRSNTGGSSGEPLTFFLGMERISHDIGAKWRATKWWGVDIGDVEIVIWGSPIELLAQDKIRQLRDGIFRSHLFPAFEMSEVRLIEFIELVKKKRPAMLFGYPSALAYIASYARQQNINLAKYGVKVAFVTSERLYDWQRELIQEVFGCPVANGYGGRDAGFIAHECPNKSMHITAEDIVVEILDENNQPVGMGECGEIVITHLASKDYPFIRYKTGDVGALDTRQCECGRSLPVLKSIEGRDTDFIVKPDGTVMHGLALIYILREVNGIKQFKITQESINHFYIEIIPDSDFLDDSRLVILNGFRNRLGNDITVNIELVEEIGAERSGKFRYVVSKVGKIDL